MPLACEMLRLQVQRQILRRRARREIRYLVPAQWQNVDLANKWTKLGPCLDFYVLGSSVHSVIGPIVSKAFAKLSVSVPRVNVGHASEAFVQDLDWAQVAGSRAKLTTSLVTDGVRQLYIVMLAIVVEPLRYLVSWLLKHSRVAKDPTKRPPLSSYANPSTSPLFFVLQYYSGLLRGQWTHSACSGKVPLFHCSTPHLYTIRD